MLAAVTACKGNEACRTASTVSVILSHRIGVKTGFVDFSAEKSMLLKTIRRASKCAFASFCRIGQKDGPGMSRPFAQRFVRPERFLLPLCKGGFTINRGGSLTPVFSLSEISPLSLTYGQPAPPTGEPFRPRFFETRSVSTIIHTARCDRICRQATSLRR